MKISKSKQTRSLIGVTSLCLLLVLATVINSVKADQFDAQIQALQAQNSNNQAASNQLAAQASSYADAINKLQQQIDSLQSAIAANQDKSNKLKDQIAQAQVELEHQKQVLGEDIKAMYLEGQTSTLEMLASSKDLSDFVDKQQARNAVQSKVKDTMARITDLQQQLKSQQTQLDELIKDQQAQNAELSSTQAQQSQMLAYTEGQKAAFDQQIKSNNSQISILRAQQAAANRRLGGSDSAGDPNHGGYPAKWDYPVAQDSLIDSWGMFNRECVSYTAWKVYETYGHMPYWGGVGNANQWPGDAVSAGIPTGSTPKPASVAISMGGAFGHAMWVESVNSNGTINVSQYNKNLNGLYSETYNINPSGLIFIYFSN